MRLYPPALVILFLAVPVVFWSQETRSEARLVLGFAQPVGLSGVPVELMEDESGDILRGWQSPVEWAENKLASADRFQGLCDAVEGRQNGRSLVHAVSLLQEKGSFAMGRSEGNTLTLVVKLPDSAMALGICDALPVYLTEQSRKESEKALFEEELENALVVSREQLGESEIRLCRLGADATQTGLTFALNHYGENLNALGKVEAALRKRKSLVEQNAPRLTVLSGPTTTHQAGDRIKFFALALVGLVSAAYFTARGSA